MFFCVLAVTVLSLFSGNRLWVLQQNHLEWRCQFPYTCCSCPVASMVLESRCERKSVEIQSLQKFSMGPCCINSNTVNTINCLFYTVYGMPMTIEIFCFVFCLMHLYPVLGFFFSCSILERIFSLLIPSLLMLIIASVVLLYNCIMFDFSW